MAGALSVIVITVSPVLQTMGMGKWSSPLTQWVFIVSWWILGAEWGRSIAGDPGAESVGCLREAGSALLRFLFLSTARRSRA